MYFLFYRVDLVSLFYQDFDKMRIASFCKQISKMARNGDPFSYYLMELSGKYLAKHIQAVYNQADEVFILNWAPAWYTLELIYDRMFFQCLKNRSDGLRIVCVGSVWQSWDLLQKGFEEQLSNETDIASVDKISLMFMKKNPAVGAAYLGARVINVELSSTFDDNYSIFYRYYRSKRI